MIPCSLQEIPPEEENEEESNEKKQFEHMLVGEVPQVLEDVKSEKALLRHMY